MLNIHSICTKIHLRFIHNFTQKCMQRFYYNYEQLTGTSVAICKNSVLARIVEFCTILALSSSSVVSTVGTHPSASHPRSDVHVRVKETLS